MNKFALAAAVVVSIFVGGCSDSRVPDIKANAVPTFKQAGFDVIGYEGYSYGSFMSGTYGGQVWYTLKRIPDNGIVYHAFLSKWGDEYHIYSITAIDAIKPTQGK